MGYYSGDGEITGGGSTVNQFQSMLWYGYHTAYQRKTTTVRRKAGVSLSTAQAEAGAINMQNQQFTSGGGTRTYFNSKGTQKNVSYSQINGSNLYELTITSDTIQVKEDGGDWQSPT